MRILHIIGVLSLIAAISSTAFAGSLENPSSYRDCNYVPLKHALIKQLGQQYSACFNKLSKLPTSSSGWRNKQTTCSGGWPSACVKYQQKKCDVSAKFERKQAVCRLKMQTKLLDAKYAKQAREEFEQRQRNKQRQAVEAERQRRAAMRRQAAEIHKYKDSAIVSSHLAGRLSGLKQPPIGGSYYLSQSLSAVGTRFVTNSVADSILQLERSVYGKPRQNGVRFVHSADNPRSSYTAQAQNFAMYSSLRNQANRTAVTPYQLPLENMSVQSAMVSGILSLIVQNQLDGVSPDLQAALSNVIAFGVSAIIDDDVPTSNTDDRRRNMFGLLEQDKKNKALEAARYKNYNYCLKRAWGKRLGNSQKAVGTNSCKLTLQCSMERYKDSPPNYVLLKPGRSMSRWYAVNNNRKHQFWYSCRYPR